MAKNLLEDEGNEADAKKRLVNKVKEGAEAAPEKEKVSEDDEVITVSVSDDEDDDDPRESPQQRQTRSERRQGRAVRHAEEARERAERERDDARRELERERQIPRYQPPPQQTQQQADPHVEALKEVRQLQRSLWNDYTNRKNQGALTPQDEADFEAKAEALKDKEYAIYVKKHSGPAMDDRTVAQAVLRMQHSDVMNHPQAASWARGRYQMLRSEGQPDSQQTVDRVMKEARKAFNLVPRDQAPPTNIQRQRFTSMSSGASGAGASDDSGGVRMGRAEKRMAIARYPKLKAEDAYKQWAKDVARQRSLRSA